MISHPELVAALAKPDADILSSLLPGDGHLIHMALGVAGESGELVDAIKRYAIYRKPIDKDNIKEELGDLLWFIEGVCQAVGFTKEECMEANIEKLKQRYESLSYSDTAAIARADKLPGT